MTDPQHKGGWTPGPWTASSHPESSKVDAVYGSGAGKVAYCQPMFGRPHVPSHQIEANARLIAAAPELYEAADAVMPLLSLIEDGLWDDCPYPDVQKRRIAALRAALSRANPSTDQGEG